MEELTAINLAPKMEIKEVNGGGGGSGETA
jgi:hypothetical protein